MYQARSAHALSPLAPAVSAAPREMIWDLYLAIGIYWRLEDDPASHRLRFQDFLDNRIGLNPLYNSYYETAAKVITDLIAELGREAAYAKIFSEKDRQLRGEAPDSPFDLTQRFVANELVALRLALGGFATFGALNYRGYFGGANIEGEPVPYRTAKDGNDG